MSAELYADAVRPCRSGDQCAHCAAGRPAAPEGYDSLDAIHELDDAVRHGLPPAYHQPYWMGISSPPGWICTACWHAEDGWVSGWPCRVAERHGGQVAKAIGVGGVS